MSTQIISKRNGFRRCGIAHSTKATVYPDDRFTADELELLNDEPMLIITEVEGGVEKETRPNVEKSIALVKAAGSLEELSKLSEGEDRKTVQGAIAKRGEELNEEAAALQDKPKQLTVKEVEEKVKTIETVKELDAMAEGEGRKTALEAIEIRRAALTAKE